MPTVVEQRSLPAAIRSLSTLSSPDYVDCFAARARHAGEMPPEYWARATIEGVAPVGRILVWRTLCGLRLEPGPDHVAGWTIAEQGDDWLRVEAASWFMTAHIVFRVEPERVLFATLIRYDHPAARIIWPPISVVHRRAVPRVLRAAVRAHGRMGA